MPKPPPAPKLVKYTPHSYTYWANRFASPVDLALSTAASVSAPKQHGAPQNVLDAYNTNDTFQAQFKSLTDYMNGNTAAMTGIKASDLNPQVAALYKQVQTLETQAQIEQNDQGPLGKIFDILSRPMYAIANAYSATIREEQAKNNSTDIQDASYIPVVGTQFWNAFTHGGDLWAGFSGQKKTDWIQILNQAHPDMNNIAKGVLGFGLDIAMDPTSYVGVGAVKTVTKDAFKLGELIAKDTGTAGTLAKYFAETPGLSQAVKEQMLKEFETTYSHHATALQYADLTSKEAIQHILTGGVGKSKRGTKDVATGGLETRASQKRVVTTFLTATADALTVAMRNKHMEELVAAAYKDGTLVDLATLNPKPAMVTLSPRALSMPEAEVTAKLKFLYSERGRLEHLRSENKKVLKAKHPKGTLASLGTDYTEAGLNAQKARVQAQIDELVTTSPLDVTDPTIKSALETITSNPGFVKMTEDLKWINDELRYWNMATDKAGNPVRRIHAPTGINSEADLRKLVEGSHVHGQNLGANTWANVGAQQVTNIRDSVLVDKGVVRGGKKIAGQPQVLGSHIPLVTDSLEAVKNYKGTDAVQRYRLLLGARDTLEAQRSKILAQHIVDSAADTVLPAGARLAKYRKIKNWQNIMEKYVAQYHAAMTAQKGADVTATAAMDAGDLAKAVDAAKGLEALGPTSKKVDQVLKDLTAELEYRLHAGQMTKEELLKALQTQGVKDPSVLHDFANLQPNVGKVLHTSDVVPADMGKIMTADSATVDAVHQANETAMQSLRIQAHEYALKTAPEVLKTAEDLMVRSMSVEARKAFALRVGFMGSGPQVAALAVPAVVDRLVEAAYKFPVVSTGIKAFNKALVSSSGLDKGINRIRAREAGRTTEVIARNGERIKQTFQAFTPAERSTAWEQMLRSDTTAFTHPQIVEAIRHELGLIAEKFQDGFFPNMRDPLTTAEVNQWIPGRYKMKDRAIKGWKLDAGRGLSPEDDPVTWLVNTLRSSPIKDMDPAQVVWDLQIATEKAIARKATVETIVQQFGIPTARFDKVQDPMAQHLVDKYGYRDHKLGTSDYIFDPETAKQLDKIDELFSSPRTLEVFGEYAGKITQVWKRSVTIYNPGFHSRNTFGDIFVSWLDGVQGVHGVQSHSMALRTIKKFRNLLDPNDPMIRSMGQPDMLNAYNKMPKPESHNVVLFKKNGKDYTMGDIYAAYVNEGLLSGYTNTEFAAVFKTPGSVGASKAGQMASGVNRNVMHLSEAREDVMRLAHFIDVIRKDPANDLMAAAAEAGARVRKFHFDYSDFTMTEKMLFARVFPFYKWTRKAFPLMVESLFAKPGKMSLYPKAMNAVAAGAGYDSTNPDIVTPGWISSRMLAPIGGSQDPTGGPATRYAGISLPYDALRSALSPQESLTSMLHPGLKLGLDWATNGAFSGKQEFDPKQQALGMFPQSNFANKQMNGTGTKEQLMSFLSGVTITQNNQKTIQAELLNRKEAAVRAQPPKPTKPII